MKSVFRAIILACAGWVAVGCGSESNTLKIGAIAGPEQQIAELAAKLAKERFDLNVEVVPFTDYVTPNVALNDGSIDLNAFQHRPYLEAQMQARGFKLSAVANTFVYPIAAYSRSINDLSELVSGDKVALPNDPTNLGRSLVLLEQQSLIKLREGAGINATVQDIVRNPLKLKFLELEAAQLPRSLDDASFAIINNTFAGQSGLSVKEHGLFVESSKSPYVNLIVAREDNKDAPEVKQFIQAYQSDEVFAEASKLFNGNLVKGW